LVRAVAGGEVADGVAQAANAAAVEEAEAQQQRERERRGKFHLLTSAWRNPGFAPGSRLAKV
jgi:hypothetical protein